MSNTDIQFKAGDVILYGSTGICEIKEISEKIFNRERAKYYVLSPLRQKGSTLFVPVDSEKLVSRMKKILSAVEIKETIGSTKDEEYPWIENDSERRKHFSETVLSGDRKQMILMVRALYMKMRSQVANGKKLHSADERFLTEAQRILNEEFSIVLGISPEEVPAFIKEQLEHA